MSYFAPSYFAPSYFGEPPVGSTYRDSLVAAANELADLTDRRDAARASLAKAAEALAAAQRESDQADAAVQQAHDLFRSAIDAALVYVPAPALADPAIKTG